MGVWVVGESVRVASYGESVRYEGFLAWFIIQVEWGWWWLLLLLWYWFEGSVRVDEIVPRVLIVGRVINEVHELLFLELVSMDGVGYFLLLLVGSVLGPDMGHHILDRGGELESFVR